MYKTLFTPIEQPQDKSVSPPPVKPTFINMKKEKELVTYTSSLDNASVYRYTSETKRQRLY